MENKTVGSDMAYPIFDSKGDVANDSKGLTKRELIASQQMVAFIMSGNVQSHTEAAKLAVQATNALIEELNK